MHLVFIPPDEVDGISRIEAMWPVIAPLLQRAVEHSEGRTTLKETVSDIMAKRKQLWVIVDDDKQTRAAAVSSLQKFEAGLMLAAINLLGGEPGHLNELLDLMPQFESWAKGEGCNRVEILLRKGWAGKLPEYKLAAYMMSKTIG